HARIVETLEAGSPERLLEQVERLAHHALHGEVWDRAVSYYRQAGAKAAARSANREAVECFQAALSALQRLAETRETIEQAIDLQLALRPVLLQLGRLEEILSVSRDAERLAQRLADEHRLARVYTYLINYHHLKGEPALALEYGQRCLSIHARTGDHALRALTERYLGHIYHTQGAYARARDVFADTTARLSA